MRNEIEYLYRPEKPVSVDSLNLLPSNMVFSRFLTEEDKAEIDKIWYEVLLKNPSAFSKPRGLASLVSVENGNLVYDFTQFMEYVSVSRTSKDRRLSPPAYENMRVLAVGATLETKNEEIFVHRRSHQATHVQGIIDSSCAGLCLPENGDFNLTKAIISKIEKELKLGRDEVEFLGVNGIHSSYAPDFSGLIDISLRTPLTSEEVTRRMGKSTFLEYWFVDKRRLGDFVFEHYVIEQDMVGDGAGTLLSSLENEDFYKHAKRLNDSGRAFKFGRFRNGVFLENP